MSAAKKIEPVEYLGTREAARILTGISQRQVTRMANDGVFAGALLTDGEVWRIPKGAVVAVLERWERLAKRRAGK